MNNNKVIVILGPTSSGKSDVAIRLAKKFGGEVVSADSRQIYRGMDIGSGKIPRDFPLSSKCKKQIAKLQPKSKKLIPFFSKEVAHYMLDIVSPNTNYSVAKFKKDAQKIIKDILKRGKVPIICGGTGFWIKAIVDDIDFPEVKPDWKLRNQLQDKSAEELFEKLQKLDPERAKNIDPKNKVRLIRAIEICNFLGKVPQHETRNTKHKKYQFLQIGIDWPKEELDKRIKIRLNQRFEEGMIDEVANLHFEKKVSWKRLESFGLEYQRIAQYLQGKLTEKEMKEKLYFDIVHYAKRQKTWFKKDNRIIWLHFKSGKINKTHKRITEIVSKFL